MLYLGLDFNDIGEPIGKDIYKNPICSIVRYERYFIHLKVKFQTFSLLFSIFPGWTIYLGITR